MFSVDFSNSSKNFLKKLPKQEADLIINKIYSIRDNPFRFLKRLQGEKLWRLRIADYRAVCEVIISANRIFVVRIGKRSRVYD